MSGKPEYRDRFGCAACGVGYLDCASYASVNLKCCADCDGHPGRWSAGGGEAYTVAETEDMWARSGRPLPADVAATLSRRRSSVGEGQNK